MDEKDTSEEAAERLAALVAKGLDAVLDAAEPAFRRFSAAVDQAAESGRERYELDRKELRRRLDDLDRDIDTRFRG